jgi:hypothetical protein
MEKERQHHHHLLKIKKAPVGSRRCSNTGIGSTGIPNNRN